MKKLMICLALIMSLTFFGVSKVTFAGAIDTTRVDLDRGESLVSTKLWIAWYNNVSLRGRVSEYSNHSVIVTFKDPSGKVINSTVVGPGGRVFQDIWWPKTGYYYVILDCYGTNKDCLASGYISEY
ncbi:hypothetical protein [Metabacillus sp. Hm71]|uniref:hypothetical protein n=1 Tax=Metabacillus sp. Hm71 TaxID=3450743 RepID=UPI003F42356F